jgi:hypothetical protein
MSLMQKWLGGRCCKHCGSSHFEVDDRSLAAHVIRCGTCQLAPVTWRDLGKPETFKEVGPTGGHHQRSRSITVQVWSSVTSRKPKPERNPRPRSAQQQPLVLDRLEQAAARKQISSEFP